MTPILNDKHVLMSLSLPHVTFYLKNSQSGESCLNLTESCLIQAEGVQDMAAMAGAVSAVEQRDELYDPLATPDVDR